MISDLKNQAATENQALYSKADEELMKKVESYHRRIDIEVASGQRDARDSFLIPASMTRSAKVTFPSSRKSFF